MRDEVRSSLPVRIHSASLSADAASALVEQ
jgi:hypothetical protein